MEGVGIKSRMPFRAELTNPIPRGEIETEGRFGPWSRESPGATPVEGKYSFNDVDLSTIKGIAGILTSTGEFRGALGRIEVKGETRTPDFSLNIAKNKMPLTTTFEAIVDGTDGDTYLKAVNARLGQTPILASGAITGTPGVKGRTVQLKVKIADGRIDDLLLLSVKTPSRCCPAGSRCRPTFCCRPARRTSSIGCGWPATSISPRVSSAIPKCRRSSAE